MLTGNDPAAKHIGVSKLKGLTLSEKMFQQRALVFKKETLPGDFLD